jgi:hypothetical protein
MGIVCRIAHTCHFRMVQVRDSILMAWQAVKCLCTEALIPTTTCPSPDPVSFWQIVQWHRTWKRGLPLSSKPVFPHRHCVVSDPMVLHRQQQARQHPDHQH